MDKKRITIGLSLAVIIMSAMFYVPAGSLIALLVLLVLGGLAQGEVYGLMAQADMPSSPKLGMATGLIYLVSTWCVSRYEALPEDMLWAVLVVLLMVNFFRMLTDGADSKRAIRSALGTLFGFMYVAFFWSFFLRLYLIGDPAEPVRVAFFLILVVKWGDGGAYFIGSKFGKRRLAPLISPKKSWEGLFGGFLFSVVVGLIWWKLNGGMLGPYELPLCHVFILGILLPTIGTLGDLVESVFKRAVDVKDSGALAHGLGGMLDMTDSLLFAAPFLYVYIKLFLA